MDKRKITIMKPILLFENKFYSISKIPLNYRVDIKNTLMSKISPTIDRDYYEHLYITLDEVKKSVEQTIKEMVNAYENSSI